MRLRRLSQRSHPNNEPITSFHRSLDGWDTKLQNFDNSGAKKSRSPLCTLKRCHADDFLMERDRIQRVNGPQYRFTCVHARYRTPANSVFSSRTHSDPYPPSYMDYAVKGVSFCFGLQRVINWH